MIRCDVTCLLCGLGFGFCPLYKILLKQNVTSEYPVIAKLSIFSWVSASSSG